MQFDPTKLSLTSSPNIYNNLIFQNGSWTHTWQGVDSSFNTQNALNIKQAFQNKIVPSLLKYKKGYELTLVNNWENCALVDLSKVIEFDDNTALADQAACAGGACEVV